MPPSRASDRHPIIIGHRGAPGLAPENTLAGFQAAADLGIDAVEFDVQYTRDGHLIVFHDNNVDRVTDGTGPIYNKTLDEVKALDAGSAFGAQFAGERIPTLRETFEMLRATELLLFMELKNPWRFDGIEAQVIELVREYDLVERLAVRSFYHAALHTLYQLAPEITLSELWYDRLPGDDAITLKTVNALHLLCTPDEIARMHARSVTVTAWTVNDVDDARRLLAAGIDGLCTNYPDRLLTLFGTL